MLKVCHVISSIDKESGGTSTYMKLLLEALDDNKIESNLICFNSHNNLPINENVKTVFVKKNKGSNLYSHRFLKRLTKFDVEIYHGNGLWQFSVHAMAKTAISKKLPFIISTHGMLESWALTQGKLKKQLALKLFQYNDLAKATCLHATAPMEIESIRNLGFKNPIAMIPNGINIKEYPNQIPNKSTAPKRILFLSRIHKKKGIENLIKAWHKLDSHVKHDWVIDIYGNGDENYIKNLKTIIKSLQLQKQINIKPPIFGKAKISVFRNASLFVLPTFSENFGIVVAEALASFTPVITTKGAPWEELETYNCGNWIDIGIDPLVESLTDVMTKTPKELLEMGINSRRLIEKKYSMQAVAIQMQELYSWLINKNEKPDFINLYNKK